MTEYVYIVSVANSANSYQYETRHEAAGHKALLDSYAIPCEIRTRKKMATDPVNAQ